MKKQILSLLLCLALVVGLVPGMVFAAPATTVTVLGEELNSSTPYLAQGASDAAADPGDGNRGDNYALFDENTSTLTLHNFSYTGRTQFLYSAGNLIISLEGQNSVTFDAPSTNAIKLQTADLTFLGDGSLSVTGKKTTIRSNSMAVRLPLARQVTQMPLPARSMLFAKAVPLKPSNAMG